MEVHRSCMLPSNAPALSTPESASDRVLQERSGNRTNIERSPSPSYHPKVYRQRLGNFGSTILAPPVGCRTEEEVEYEFRKIWTILQNHPRYQKYRDKKPKEGEKKSDDGDLEKWPDYLERAFFRALIRWPPTGRDQYVVDGERKGRNQLVSRSIFLETGVLRQKKQISSHLQVLKPKLLDLPQVLKHLSKPGKVKKGSARDRAGQIRHRQASYSVKRDDSRMDDAAASLYGRYGIAPPTNPHYAVRGEAEAPFTMMHFEMLVQDHNKQAVHYVTQLGDNPRLGDVHFPDISTWNMQYPELNFHRVSDWRDRQVLICHASIDLMDKQPVGAELAIKYAIDSAHDLSHFEPMHCRTRFYDSGKLAYEEERQCEYATNTRSNLHFGSQFWVRRMSDLRMRILKGQRHEDPSIARKMEKEVQRSLQYMTAVQDVYGTRSDLGMQQCLLTVLWRFRQTRTSHEVGRVSWRVAYFPQDEDEGLVGQEEQQEQQHQQQMWDKTPGVGAADFEVPHDLKLILNSTASPVSSGLYNTSSLPLDLSQHHHQHHLPSLPPLDLDTLSHLAPLSTHDHNPHDPLAGFPPHPNSAATVHSLASTDFSQSLSHVPSLTHSAHTSQDSVAAAAAGGVGGSGELDFHRGGHLDVRLHDGHIPLGPAISFDDGTAGAGAYDEGVDAGALQLEPGILDAQDMSVSAAAASASVFGDLGLDGMGALATGAGMVDASCYQHELSVSDCYPTAPSSSKPWHYADLIARMEESAAVAAAEGQNQETPGWLREPHRDEMDLNVVGPTIGLHHHHHHGNSRLGQHAQQQHSHHSLWKLQTGFAVGGAEQDVVDVQQQQQQQREEEEARKEQQARGILEMIERGQRGGVGVFQ